MHRHRLVILVYVLKHACLLTVKFSIPAPYEIRFSAEEGRRNGISDGKQELPALCSRQQIQRFPQSLLQVLATRTPVRCKQNVYIRFGGLGGTNGRRLANDNQPRCDKIIRIILLLDKAQMFGPYCLLSFVTDCNVHVARVSERHDRMRRTRKWLNRSGS